MAPIICFTTDEAWSYASTGQEYTDDSVHLQDWPVAPGEWTDEAMDHEMSSLLKVRALVNERIEPARQAGTIGKALDAAITIATDSEGPVAAVLAKHQAFLPELFIVSLVDLDSQPGAALNASVQSCTDLGQHRCPRCWRWVAALTPSAQGEVCPRCETALQS